MLIRQRRRLHRPLPRPGRVALEITLHARGIVFRHSRPYHPQTCGKVERFHQTLKKWLATQPRARTTRASCNASSTPSADYYNTERPHRALHRATPVQAYARPTQSRRHRHPARSAGTTASATTASTRNGKLTLRHNSRLHHIGLGRRHAGTTVLILVHDLHVRIITTNGELLRDFHLDPDPDYQPQTQTVNDVPRHLCTVSRDIARVREGGFEPPLDGV